MCGIVGYIGPRPVLPILIGGLKKLEYRGYDSAGCAAVTPDNTMLVFKAKGKVSNLEEKTKECQQPCTLGIAHTRWATHGVPAERNAHPHIGGDNELAVIHNGIIENFQELKENLLAKGYVFKSETDTEGASTTPRCLKPLPGPCARPTARMPWRSFAPTNRAPSFPRACPPP